MSSKKTTKVGTHEKETVKFIAGIKSQLQAAGYETIILLGYKDSTVSGFVEGSKALVGHMIGHTIGHHPEILEGLMGGAIEEMSNALENLGSHEHSKNPNTKKPSKPKTKRKV